MKTIKCLEPIVLLKKCDHHKDKRKCDCITGKYFLFSLTLK